MRLSTRTIGVLGEVERERLRQDELWGIQNWSDGTGSQLWERNALTAKSFNRRRVENGRLQWLHILEEEVYEAFAEHDDPAALREELVQVAAVAVAWIECIDRRTE
jgi:hypothetical protein